ncbi:MATE family efflux transporter [Candidatus Izimaplasma bacterium]|nr:MATE family efflux transporter [Candidatus Izimaplasma bacterium]
MKKKRDLTTGSIYKNLLWVAIPTLLASLVQMAYNLTDMYWVGQLFYESEAIAAVATGGFYMWFGYGLIMLVKIGTSVNVSHAAGVNNHEAIESYGNNGFILMVIVGIIYTLIGVFGGSLFVDFFQFDSQIVIDYAYQYLGVISTFVIAMFMVNLFNGIYDGLGLTIMTFLVSATGLVLNMILDPIFIHETLNIFGGTINGLGLEVKGAAIATVISQSFVLLIYIGIYLGKTRPFHLHPFKYFSLEPMKKILKIGYPIALQSLLFTVIAIIMTKMQNAYGFDIVATQRLGSQIEAFAWMVASGFQIALASFVGQNFAAGRLDRVKEGYKASLKMLIPYGIVISILMYVFSRELFAIFFDNPDMLVLGDKYLKILAVSQLFMIVELGTAGAFNGLGKTKYPSIVGIVGNILRVPLAAVLALSMGFAGIWWAISISSILKGSVLVYLLVLYLRKIIHAKATKLENT